MNTQGREHRIGHSGLVEPRHIFCQQPDERRQTLRHRRRGGHRTPAGLHTRLRFQRLQHLFQTQRHSLARFLQGVLDGLSPFGLVGLALCGRIILPVPIVRNHAQQLLQRIAADTPDGHRQFKCQRIPITLHRLPPAIEQLPVLLDDLRIRHPVVVFFARTTGLKDFLFPSFRTETLKH